MTRQGVGFDDQPPIQAAHRRRWLYQVPGVLAGATCACGTCPSIELEDERGTVPTTGSRVVLTAATRDALLLLFIDGDRPSYLELAPTGETPIDSFPSTGELLFDA